MNVSDVDDDPPPPPPAEKKRRPFQISGTFDIYGSD